MDERSNRLGRLEGAGGRGALPSGRERLDVIELGCGTAYFGAWLKKRGARRVVGVDITPAQLATARTLNAESGLDLNSLKRMPRTSRSPMPPSTSPSRSTGRRSGVTPTSGSRGGRLLRLAVRLCSCATARCRCCARRGRLDAGPPCPAAEGNAPLDWTDEKEEESTEFHISGSEMFSCSGRRVSTSWISVSCSHR